MTTIRAESTNMLSISFISMSPLASDPSGTYSGKISASGYARCAPMKLQMSSTSGVSTKPHCKRFISEPVEMSMSPRPMSWSAPEASKMVRESIFDNTLKAIRAGKFALIIPVMTFTDGRCVATMRWIPMARASCAIRAIGCSTSLPAVMMRSANSSMSTTM